MMRFKHCVTRWMAPLVLAGLSGTALHAELVLVEDGKVIAPVVVFENAPRFTRLAAEQLVDTIEKMSGVRPPLLEGRPDPLPAHAVWVGYQPVLDGLFPDLDFTFQHPEEILIAANDAHLVVAGRDLWHPGHMQAMGAFNVMIDGIQQEYGTLNAVYTFLQDYLDVRWLWPGEIGEDIPRKERIAFAPFAYRYHPQIRSREGLASLLGIWRSRNQIGPFQQWLISQRVQFGSLRIGGGHGFGNWWDRFHETNPEYFALQPDGTRGGGETPYPSAGTVKMCKSNPAVWDQWMADVAAQIERNPNLTVFNAAANDAGHSGYCICENCLAWDHPEGEMVHYSWRGLGQDYVAQSDRQVTFANTLGRRLKTRYPDRDYYVLILAYGNSRPPPVAAVPDDNVVVGSVANFHNRPEAPERHRKQFTAWGKIAPNLAWRPNLGHWAGWSLGFPNVAPRRVIEDLRLVAENNVIGIFFDQVWGHWANQGPHYYMLAQMAWNPYADGEAILADFYRRAFGPAVEPMTAYWTLMDEASDEHMFGGKPEAEVWGDAFYQQAYAYLDRAAGATEDAAAVYAERLAFVRAGLDVMRLFRENQALIARLRQTGGEDGDALAQARDNWKTIVRIFKAQPLAFNPSYVRPGLGRLEAVNPDSDH